MKPKSLYEIYVEINKGQPLGVTFFRIRDVLTLEDYVTCHVKDWKWNWENKPEAIWVLLLEEPFNYFHQFNTQVKKYTLLSSMDELQYFRANGEQVSMNILKSRYRYIC